MPHITEGLLHAHLDGALGPDEQLQWAEAEAHLEVCDDCRRRLDEAAELRDVARDLLAAATPVGSATRPTFDELVSRARASRVDPASGRKPSARAGGAWWRTPAALGWAASLVIAAGAGWIGRQLVVEQGLDAPAVVAEGDATVGRTEADDGAVLDELRDGTTSREAQTRRDAATAPAAPEAARTEVGELQEKVGPRTDAEAEADIGAEASRMREIVPLTAGAEAPGGARCYAISAEAGDGGEGAVAGQPETLRLAPDGTASVRLDGRAMVGFWERAEADSVHLRVTDGERWREFAFIDTEDGVRGDAELDAVACP